MMTKLFSLVLLMGLVASIGCNKEEEPNCQSDTYWADITIDGKAYNTLSPCADWSVVIDSVIQYIDPQPISGFYFSKLTNRFTISRPDTTGGTVQFDLFFFAPATLIETTINGSDTLRFITPTNICAILDSNYHRLGNSLNDTSAVVTNIQFTNNDGKTLESFYVSINWQISGYGFQPLDIEGVVEDECRTRFEMNALLSDSLATDTIAIYGNLRIPLK